MRSRLLTVLDGLLHDEAGAWRVALSPSNGMRRSDAAFTVDRLQK